MSGEEIDDLVSGSDTFMGEFYVSAESGCNSNDETADGCNSNDAHHYMHRNFVYVSLDLEQGGEYCGIVQLPYQLLWLREEVESKLVGEIENEFFNEYTKPPDNAI